MEGLVAGTYWKVWKNDSEYKGGKYRKFGQSQKVCKVGRSGEREGQNGLEVSEGGGGEDRKGGKYRQKGKWEGKNKQKFKSTPFQLKTNGFKTFILYLKFLSET